MNLGNQKLTIFKKNQGLTRTRTWVKGVRILCDNRYTTRPNLAYEFKYQLYNQLNTLLVFKLKRYQDTHLLIQLLKESIIQII
ncbi:unnamed protein product [Paramecium octaurelia]|uniref:Uncharacterized protein n=1 Tax=Paramecium octaurelia TaxID=43137 RepID=A0A8S1VHV9_PAROT|nr:unnamed protein product [Paramecium octaurelia]